MSHNNKHISRFPETRWSLIGRAAASDELTRQEALTELLLTYAPGLRAFLIESRHISIDIVDDLLHDFIADKFLARKLVHHADQGKGKFRNFILKSLNNFVNTKLRKSHADPVRVVDLDDTAPTASAMRAETDRFDQEWVQQVVMDALRLMEMDCTTPPRSDYWKVFCFRIVDPLLKDVEPARYDDIVRDIGIETPRQAMNLLANAKRCFDKHLRTAVGRYVPKDRIDDEMDDLRDIVSR